MKTQKSADCLRKGPVLVAQQDPFRTGFGIPPPIPSPDLVIIANIIRVGSPHRSGLVPDQNQDLTPSQSSVS